MPVPELIMVVPLIEKPVSDTTGGGRRSRSIKVSCCGNSGHRSPAA
jgi:hypothetical protein